MTVRPWQSSDEHMGPEPEERCECGECSDCARAATIAQRDREAAWVCSWYQLDASADDIPF